MATVVTRTGKAIMSGRMIGATPTQAAPLYLAWGLNPVPTTAQNTDVALFSESAEARTGGTQTQTTTTNSNDTYQVTGTQTATAARVIQEAGIYDSPTQPAASTVSTGSGIIASSIGTSVTTAVALTTGTNYVQVRGEVMHVTAGSGTTALTVTRGANGSTAVTTIASGDPITQGNYPGALGGVAGGNMYAKADMAAINLNNGDSITWTWSVTFS
jgi:hypothetical protein